MICTKFDWNWPAGSGEEDFYKVFSVFLLFRDYLSLETGNPLHLYNLEFPPPKEYFVPGLVKIGPVVLEKKSKM
jgi:hypothetical protein